MKGGPGISGDMIITLYSVCMISSSMKSSCPV